MTDDATFDEINAVMMRHPRSRSSSVVRLVFDETGKPLIVKVLNKALVANGYSRMPAKQIVAAINR
ncbi:MAG: hypothetical protein ISR50_07300 [Alphaproteobacteria bacterium]|nr:hypothetical protein [Alphaproteobacteria bacterium]